MIVALKSPWLYARIFVGLILAYAGFTKLVEPIENFRGVVASYPVIPYVLSPLIAAVLPWIELFAGVFLIIGYAPRLSAMAAAALFFGFLIVLGSSDALLESGKDCGCFGQGALIHLTTQQVFVLDLINFLLALKLCSLKDSPLSLDHWLKKR